MTLDVDQVVDIATQLVILIGGLIAIVGGASIGLKRWVRKAVAEPLNEQLQPNGGRQETTRHLVEEIADKTNQLVERVEEIDQATQQARTQAQAALTIAKETGDRLDRHMDRQEERRDG